MNFNYTPQKTTTQIVYQLLYGLKFLFLSLCVLTFHCHVFLVKLNIKIAKRWTVFSNNMSTTIRKYSLRAFIWVVTPLDLLNSSGFRSFLGLVKFAFGSERVKMISWDHSVPTNILNKHYLFSQWTSQLLFFCFPWPEQHDDCDCSKCNGNPKHCISGGQSHINKWKHVWI